MSLRTTVLGQQVVITELQAMDHRRQQTAGDRQRLQRCWRVLRGSRDQLKGLAQPDLPEVGLVALQAMINQGVTAALAARDADRNTNQQIAGDKHSSLTH
ncbi:hypothetical protein Tco_1039031 [Tanacetum coccineum]